MQAVEISNCLVFLGDCNCKIFNDCTTLTMDLRKIGRLSCQVVAVVEEKSKLNKDLVSELGGSSVLVSLTLLFPV